MLITQAHFGSNIIYSGHSTAPGSPLDRFSDWIGATNFRYPGGTVTERLSHRDGSLSELFDKENSEIVTVSEALAFAEGKGADITFVLPTHTFLTEGPFGERAVDEEALSEFLLKVLDVISGEYGPPVIRTFEIGNEWWYLDERMTANEYGMIANAYAKGLGEIYKIYEATLDDPTSWTPPNIAVQTGAYWRGPESNSTIIDSLDEEAKQNIDMVIAHFYPRDLSQAQGTMQKWKAIQEFLDDDGFGDLKILISEWNISRHAEAKGMEHASLLTETFKTMLENGVDEANIWGTNYKHLSTKLAKMSHNHGEGVEPEEIDLHLTPAGEVFRMMAQNLVGKELLGIGVEHAIVNLDEGFQGDMILVQGYGSNEQLTIFISNLSEYSLTFNINEKLIPDDFTHVWAQHMSAHDDPSTQVNEGDPNSMHARGLVTTRNQDTILNEEGKIELDANGIMKISYTLDGVGVRMVGTDQIVDPYLLLSDHLIGGLGNDTIFGNLGDDLIFGVAGNNIIFGGSGNDTLIGGEGNDLINSGADSNHLESAHGDNIFLSMGSADTLVGGVGNDLFYSSGASSHITANGGANLFHFEGGGSHVVKGFSFDNGDILSFGGIFRDDLHFISSLSAEEDEITGRFDLIICEEESGLEVRLLGLGDKLTDIEDFILDFLSAQERADELGFFFSGMDASQSEAFISSFEGSDAPSIFNGIEKDQLLEFIPCHIVDFLINDSSSAELCDEIDEHPEDEANSNFWHDYIDSIFSDVESDEKHSDEGTVNIDKDPPGSQSIVEEEDESDAEDGSTSASSGTCFVATAAFRNQDHPDVVFLRRFRDQYLVDFYAGRKFISFYWTYGPILAVPVRKSDVLAFISRQALKFVVRTIKIFWRGV